MADKQQWPSWRYGPPGRDGKPQARVFNKDDVIPKGWKDHPSKVKAAKIDKDPAKDPPKDPPKDQESTPEERVATIASVREAAAAANIDIQLSDDASVEEINAAIDKLTAQQGS